MSSVRLLVDVGNSRAKFGLFDESRDIDGLPKCWYSITVEVGTELPWSQVRDWSAAKDLEGGLGFIAGSNPPEIARVKQHWPEEFGSPVEVGYVAETFPLEVNVPEPAKVGIDRLLNAIAANTLRQVNQPVLIVDTGTATTVDAVNAEGVFLGGAILPGFELSARALHHYTALLPLIPLNEFVAQQPEPLGKSTRAAMRGGLFWGQVGAVKELLEQIRESLDLQQPEILITGGGGALLAPQIPSAIWLPHLSLQGLALLLDET